MRDQSADETSTDKSRALDSSVTTASARVRASEALRLALRSAEVTATDIAAACDVHPSRVAHWMSVTHHHTIGAHRLLQMASRGYESVAREYLDLLIGSARTPESSVDHVAPRLRVAAAEVDLAIAEAMADGTVDRQEAGRILHLRAEVERLEASLDEALQRIGGGG